jgi:hypothetical protein
MFTETNSFCTFLERLGFYASFQSAR